MSWFRNFRSRVCLRWWSVTILWASLTVALYMVMEAAAQPLLGYTYSNPYGMTTRITSAIWYCRIFIGAAILLTFFVNSLYISNADTELWRMENIELTRRIAAYEAELVRRKASVPFNTEQKIKE